jgi:hypothetical protein
MNDDAYFKDFTDVIDNDPEIAEEIGILKFTTYVGDSAKCNIPKIESSVYKCHQILGIVPQEKEYNIEFRKSWAKKLFNV